MPSFSAVLLILGLALSFAPHTFASQKRPEEIIAYVFAQDRILHGAEIRAEELTRINYAFANIENGVIVDGFPHDTENLATLVALKHRNPQLKILISVGGWTWSGRFSDMTLTKASRATFLDSAMHFLEAHDLDGIDIDWEYPGLPGNGNVNRPQDKQHYTTFLKELRHRLDREEKKLGRNLYSSVATGSQPKFLAHTEMAKVQRYVDTVNLMCYDYYEPDSDRITGNHAPLFRDPHDPKAISSDASVQAYLKAGVPPRKIVLGVPFYGHAWSGVQDVNHGLFQPGVEAHLEADYKYIVQSLLPNGYTRYWDSAASAPYLYSPTAHVFVSYEDVQSLAAKCAYVLRHKLGGIMFWDLSGDANGALLNAIDTSLHKLPAAVPAE